MGDHRGISTFVTDDLELKEGSLDLFTVPKIDNKLHSGQPTKYRPLNALNDSGPFEFQISADPEHFIKLPSIRLAGTVRVKTSETAQITAADVISVCNLFPHSLFKQIEVLVNDKPVNDQSSATYPIKSCLEATCSFSKEALETHMVMAGFEKDDPQYAEAYANNSGWINRKKRIIDKDYKFDIHLHVDFFHCHRWLLPIQN